MTLSLGVVFWVCVCTCVCTCVALIGADDNSFMLRAIELASKANGHTSPNPCVGCVIVDAQGKVVGEGWHVRAGEPHAEVMALRNAGELAKGGTAYVSLEPCNHYGRTPPCTLALIKSGVARVVAGLVDPDPRVSGRGLALLKEKGLKVDVCEGALAEACREINRPFIYRVMHNRTYGIVWTSALEEEEDKQPVVYLPTARTVLQLISSLAPEADTLVLSIDQFLKDWTNESLRERRIREGHDPGHECESCFEHLPSHLSVVVADLEETAGPEVIKKCHDAIIKIQRAAVKAPKRKWLLFHGKGTHVANEQEEESLQGNEQLQVHSSPHLSSLTLFLEKTRTFGCNAALLFAYSHEQMEEWTKLGICQKLIVSRTDSFAGKGKGRVEQASGLSFLSSLSALRKAETKSLAVEVGGTSYACFLQTEK